MKEKILHLGILKLGTAKAGRGKKTWGTLLVRQGRKKVSLPVCVIHGAREGKHAVITANQHGRELTSFAAAARFCEEIDPRKLKGTIIVLPCMNPTAALLELQAWTEGESPESAAKSHGSLKKNAAPVMADFCYRTRYNMNWNWPGKANGTLVERMTYEIWNRVILDKTRKPDMVLDIHCHEFPSAGYAAGAKEMDVAVLCGLPYVYVHGGTGDASLEGACLKHGIPLALSAELQSDGTIPPGEDRRGVRMILNYLKYLGMLSGKLELPRRVLVLKPWGVTIRKPRGLGSINIVAKQKGVVLLHKRTIERVRKGDLICEMLNPSTGRVVQTVRAPRAGWIGFAHEIRGILEKGGRICRIDPYAEFVDPAKKCPCPSKRID